MSNSPDPVEEFLVPTHGIPVRLQVGDAPVVLIGWVEAQDGMVPNLLREVADEIETIEAKRRMDDDTVDFEPIVEERADETDT
jgi:hypothetical protein